MNTLVTLSIRKVPADRTGAPVAMSWTPDVPDHWPPDPVIRTSAPVGRGLGHVGDRCFQRGVVDRRDANRESQHSRERDGCCGDRSQSCFSCREPFSVDDDGYIADIQIRRGDLSRVLRDDARNCAEYIFGDRIAELTQDVD